MSKLIKKVENGKVKFYYNKQRINPLKYYELRYRLSEKDK